MSSEGLPSLAQQSSFERLVGFFSPKQPGPAKLPARKRPTNLLFDVDEIPPSLIALGASFQHIFLMSVGWLYIVVIVNAAGGTAGQTLNVIRMSMIASGIATIVQAQKGKIGSGYLCPLSSSLT